MIHRNKTQKAQSINDPQQTYDDVFEFLNALYIPDNLETATVQENDVVQLDYTKIISDPDYKRMIPEYQAFIEANKQTIFTAIKPEDITMSNTFDLDVVSLKEDLTSPRWVFSAADLIKVKLGETE